MIGFVYAIDGRSWSCSACTLFDVLPGTGVQLS
jgi:hypothetical protein